MFNIQHFKISEVQNLKTSKTQNLKIFEFWDFEILNFYNSGAALGIGAASFASVRAKIERKARRHRRNAQVNWLMTNG